MLFLNCGESMFRQFDFLKNRKQMKSKTKRAVIQDQCQRHSEEENTTSSAYISISSLVSNFNILSFISSVKLFDDCACIHETQCCTMFSKEVLHTVKTLF
jgi:hypothetical protein